MIHTVRDTDPSGCAGKNCPGLHIDDETRTAWFEGAISSPEGKTPGPGETFVGMPLDVAARIVADAKARGLL